jgi:hypothetical protein
VTITVTVTVTVTVIVTVTVTPADGPMEALAGPLSRPGQGGQGRPAAGLVTLTVGLRHGTAASVSLFLGRAMAG